MLPIYPTGNATIHNIFKKRWVSEENHLLEGSTKFGDNSVYLRFVVARRDDRDRISLARKIPATIRRKHTTNPGAEREADDSERTALVGVKAIVEYLFEACSNP